MAIPLASLGSPGRIGDVHIDAILRISGPRRYTRTQTPIESGAQVSSHRQREPIPLELEIVISDAEPVFGAGLTPLWEARHAAKTRQRLIDIMDVGTVITVFDGAEFWRGRAGTRAWIIDEIEDQKLPDDNPVPGAPSTWRATIKIGEHETFETTFTTLDPDVDASIEDNVDGISDGGQQSTETVPDELAGSIPT